MIEYPSGVACLITISKPSWTKWSLGGAHSTDMLFCKYPANSGNSVDASTVCLAIHAPLTINLYLVTHDGPGDPRCGGSCDSAGFGRHRRRLQIPARGSQARERL